MTSLSECKVTISASLPEIYFVDSNRFIKLFQKPAEYSIDLTGSKAKRRWGMFKASNGTTRRIFNDIAKKYREYIELYKQLNNGSIVGATPFSVFYWRFVYYSKYWDIHKFMNNGY